MKIDVEIYARCDQEISRNFCSSEKVFIYSSITIFESKAYPFSAVFFSG